jgi:Ser/Thr protein kinase RdoA (MazF antagonist)
VANSTVSPIVADVLRCFGQTQDVTSASFPTPGFSGAIVVRVNGPVGEFCLRGWPPDELPERRIRGLHRLLQHIHQQGVGCVSVPVRSEMGDTLVRRRGRCWQLEPWLPGAADFWSNPSESRLRSAARCLAEWHRATKLFVPRQSESEWFACRVQCESPAVRERLQRVRDLQHGGIHRLRASLPTSGRSEFHDIGRHILELFPHAASAIESELIAAKHFAFDLQPCLRDIWHDHILFTGDEVTGLIDASACRYENVATDLARLFGSLIEDEPDGWEIALDEYQRHSPLTTEELALVQTLDRSAVLLAGITWLRRSVIENKPVANDERVVLRMQTIATRLERLMRTL